MGFGVLAIFCAMQVKAESLAPEPIVIIPGIGASSNLDILLEAELEASEVAEERDEWDFTPGTKSFDQLIQAFEDKGLVEGEDFFIAFYDWRLRNTDSALTYLVPVIDEALTHSESGKVDIIAHSMGGLVGRAYIQGDGYRDDVDQFIMLGTPNHGSSDVYTLWEGGEVPDNWDASQKEIINSYIWYLTNVSFFTQDAYDTIRYRVPSVQELLPTYDYLVDKNTGETKFVDQMVEQNGFLFNLNSQSMVNFASRVPGGIYTFAGTGIETVGNIPVVPTDDEKLWADGKPDPETPVRDTLEGDNRVLISSAHLDEPPVVTQGNQTWFEKILELWTPQAEAGLFFHDSTIESGHGALPTTTIEDVFNILGFGLPVRTYAVIPDPEEILSFWIASPVDVKVIDPSGKAITKTNKEIPGATYDGQEDPLGFKEVVIENPVPGTYTVELTGLEDGSYHFAAAHFGEGPETIETVEKDIALGEKVAYTVSFNAELATPLEISDPFIPEEPAPPTPLGLTIALIAYVDELKTNGTLASPVYQELRAPLVSAQNMLSQAETLLASNHPQKERNAATLKRFAAIHLTTFIAAVDRRHSVLPKDITTNLISRAQTIKDLIGIIGPLRPPAVSPVM